MAIQTINPATNEIIESFDEMNDKAVDSAVEQASKAFDSWKKTSFQQRAEILHKVAELMRENKDKYAKMITLEMGKVITQAEGEIDLSADIFDYYATNGEAFLADKPLNPKFGQAFIRNTPIGVLFGIEPWNFPFYQIARFAAPNIMVGNTILIKTASLVPQCGIAIEELFKKANAPLGLYTNLMISGKRASALVADERIKGVSLTGSEEAGASIATEAGKNIKKSVLELGGSDAFIVLEDADITKAAEWGIIGRINNNGECCVASKRFIVVEAVADKFLAIFKDKMANLVIGDPMNPKTDLGPLSSTEALQHILEQLKSATKAGAKILLGGKRIDRVGNFLQPTILSEITPQNPAYHEELFGPVATFYRVKDEKAAIELANDSNFGLGCSIFTQNVERGKHIADQIDTGMVFINHPTWTQADLPFGGTKKSGYGRELSELGVEEFVNKKLIRVSSLSDPM